jgi:hypothetical protein
MNGLIILALAFVGIFNPFKYHVFWANKIETARSFEKSLMDISLYLKTTPFSAERYILTGNMQRIPIKLFNQGLPNTYYLFPGQSGDIDPKNPDNLIVIMTERNDEVISGLQKRFPNLNLEEKKDDLGISYYVLR